jgi:hypothetical protein
MAGFATISRNMFADAAAASAGLLQAFRTTADGNGIAALAFAAPDQVPGASAAPDNPPVTGNEAGLGKAIPALLGISERTTAQASGTIASPAGVRAPTDTPASPAPAGPYPAERNRPGASIAMPTLSAPASFVHTANPMWSLQVPAPTCSTAPSTQALPGWYGFETAAALGGTESAATRTPGGTVSVAASPVRTTAALTQVLYLQEVGDPTPISVNDIHQGQFGDCFLLSSIGEIALWHPSAITNMIHVNAIGSETVTLYLGANGSLPTFGTTSFTPTSITVKNAFQSNAVNNGATQDVLNGQKEIWVQVLENAVATLNGGYSGIAGGGYPVIAMEELTGQAASWMSASSLTLQQLQSHVVAGDLIVMDTRSSGNLPYGLYGSHAYMFETLTMVNGAAMVQLGNPWGFAQPALIPLAQLAAGIGEVDIGHVAATKVIPGTSGNDTIKLPNAVTYASIDLGAGNDTLILANGTNSAVVANTETILGGTGADSISIVSPAVGACIDLGAGNDLVVLGNFTNSATISNVETIIGGSGADTIKLGTALVNGSVDLGAGSDTLQLANGANTVFVANTETVLGGTGADRIVLSGANASMVVGNGGMNFITGNGGADEFVVNQNGAGNSSTILNFNAAKGDRIALDTTAGATMSGNAYDLGAGGLVAGINLVSVADAAARLKATEATGGKGGFAYQQNTGGLFYSGNGRFAGGGTMVGVIDGSSGAPWIYNTHNFVQV